MTANGLTHREAAARRARDGSNVLPDAVPRTPFRIAAQAIREPMLVLLLGAGAIYIALGDARDAALLSVSIVLVVALAVIQDVRAERALQALREQGAPRATVVREGNTLVIPSSEVVVGDLLLVEAGDRIAADARLIAASDLDLDESLLTGESLPVPKAPDAQTPEHRVIRAGTLVVRGRGSAEVVAIGADTAFGRIGTALRDVRAPPTPLQRQMRALVHVFALLSFSACAFVTIAMHARGAGWLESALAGVTLAIATIPEEFPVVVTVFLALGAWRMSKRAALVRKRAAIEALGSITVLCTDKTGTLTENRMRLAEIDDAFATAPGLLHAAALAAPPASRDPMDIALREGVPEATQGWQLLHEYPFSAARRSMGVAWRAPDGHVLLACKGAPEAVASACGLRGLEAAAIERSVAEMASRGLRVLGVAGATADVPPRALEDAPWRWRGLVAFSDPLRGGVREAVAQARDAGVRVVMLTGDHAGTAQAIGRAAGLARTDVVLTGDTLAAEPAAAMEALGRTDVFARVRPEHKLRLVEILQRQGEVVAMTGDGVNDAPALAAAHVGVAMGGRGTDVAREAAAIVLVDDNFATLVHAIAEGRRIYANMRRAVRYILAVHVPITGLALLPLLLGLPPVMAPIHIVLLELIIDPACSIVFESDGPDPGDMRKPPRPPNQRIVGARRLVLTLLQGLAMFAPVAATDLLARRLGWPIDEIRALDFTTLVAGNLALILVYRPGRTLRDVLRAPNVPFAIAAAATLVLLAATTRIGVVGQWLAFAPPPWGAWLAALGMPLLIAACLKALMPGRRDPLPRMHPR